VVKRSKNRTNEKAAKMGYTTKFDGRFELDRPLTKGEARYLEGFSASRRIKRDPNILQTDDDPIRTNVDLPLGEEGCYFLGDDDRNAGWKRKVLSLCRIVAIHCNAVS
jgi:hypothetical protein